MTTTPTSRTFAWLRRFAKLWGFALFCVFVVYIFREVVLPFLFAILVAYILAPLVARAGQVRVGARRPFPRWAGGHHPLRQHPRGPGRCSSATSSRSCPATSPGCSARRRSCSPRSTRTGCRGRAPGSTRTSAPRRSIRATTATPQAEEPPGAARDPGRAADRRALPHRSRRGQPRGDAARERQAPDRAARSRRWSDTGGGGKWERSIKQWLATRLKSTEGESRRVLEYGQKFIAGVVSGIGTAVPGADGGGVHPDRSRSHPGFLRSLVPERYQGDYDRIYVGIDRGLSGVIRGQLLICLINGVADLHRSAGSSR